MGIPGAQRSAPGVSGDGRNASMMKEMSHSATPAPVATIRVKSHELAIASLSVSPSNDGTGFPNSARSACAVSPPAKDVQEHLLPAHSVAASNGDRLCPTCLSTNRKLASESSAAHDGCSTVKDLRRSRLKRSWPRQG